MSCKNVLSGQDATQIGILLARATAPHEISVHEERPCWHGRVEAVAFVAHVFGIRPQDLEKVRDRLKDHLTKCGCSPRAIPPEGW